MRKIILFIFVALVTFTSPVLAVSDPRLKPNNKVGINILSPEAEIEEASTLVNTNGDWGWVVIIIKKDERNVDRWQSVLNEATKYHLIPIIRLATQPDSQGFWQRPTDEDAKAWADFLSKLYFPTKNRYVEVYNEVNRASEWGGNVDAAGYAKELKKTIDALKSKSSDFFVLNAPLDLSLVNSNTSLEASIFYQTMDATVPGIFKMLDGWASHSYPNPDFSTPPYVSGKTGINGYLWELSETSKYLDGKDLPVFITETGWKRKIGQTEGLDEDLISQYYKVAFENIWSDKRVVAVAPFVFDYRDPLFAPFSFKVLGEKTDKNYYDYFYTIRDLEKVKGEPERENFISNINFKKSLYVAENSESVIALNFKNTGNYIWNIDKDLRLKAVSGQADFGKISWNSKEIYPGQEANVSLKMKSKVLGDFPLLVQILWKDKPIAKETMEIKSVTKVEYLFQQLKSIFGQG